MSQSKKTSNPTVKNSFEEEVKHLLVFIRTLKLEGLLLAALMVVLTYKAGTSLWFLVVTFLLFDISMIGYIKNEKIGALTYNIGHSSIVPTALLIVGILINNHQMQIWSYAWLFHISVDRALGYGLKHKTSFKHTHLGTL